jgi:hypothetical protein
VPVPRVRSAVACVAAAALLLLMVAGPSARAPSANGDPPAHAPIPIGPNALDPCPGDAITPTLTITGAFPESLLGSYVMLPFDVPEGTTQVRVKYCWEGGGNTVDLGLWHARDGAAPWSEEQFRGWGGSSHPDVAISPQGFSSEAEYLAAPKGHVPGRTTRGFVPGPLPSGTWAAELGIAFVTSDGDGHAEFRVEIALSDDPAFAAEPYQPAPYDETPANASPGWYLGDLHVHGEHSALGDATMTEVFEFAFTPRDEGGAGLDFLTLSDYVTPSAWGEIGRYQADHPGKLVIRSTEIITYDGHVNQHGSLRYFDHRIGGPVWELDRVTGALTLLRERRVPAELMAEIEAAGGVAQLNHVETCSPLGDPSCRRTCRGCAWVYTPEDTDVSRVDAVELPAGRLVAWLVYGPFAVDFWEEQLAAGHRLAAVGVSDSHQAGRTDGNALRSPIGDSSTMVYAEELSEAGIVAAIRAGHTYAKLYAAGPDLRFSVTGDDGGTGILGDAIPDRSGTLHAEVSNVPDDLHRLRLYRNGELVDDVAVPATGLEQDWHVATPGLYRIEVRDQISFLHAVSSSIQVPEPSAGAGALAAAAALAALRRRRSDGRARPCRE